MSFLRDLMASQVENWHDYQGLGLLVPGILYFACQDCYIAGEEQSMTGHCDWACP